MKKIINLLIFAIFLIIGLTSLVNAESCSEDGAIRCYDRVNAQFCTDWDGTGMKWGFCSSDQIQKCIISTDFDSCMKTCIGKTAFLTIGVAVKEFQFTPQPPELIWNKQFACIYGVYYETSCYGNSINVRQTNCQHGCDGDKCKDIPPDECSSTGYIGCNIENPNQYRKCLEGSSGNNVWGNFISCPSGKQCVEEQGCIKDVNNYLVYIIIVIAIALIIFGGYMYLKKK